MLNVQNQTNVVTVSTVTLSDIRQVFLESGVAFAQQDTWLATGDVTSCAYMLLLLF